MHLTLNDAILHYDQHAAETDAASDAVPLLFLHGALGVRGQCDALAARFADRHRILLDFPSHGDSMFSGTELSTLRLASHVQVLLDELNVEQVDIYGYSMGGYVGLELASIAPARVRSVVTHAMKFYWTPEAINASLADLDLETIRGRSQRAFDALSAMHSANGLDTTIAQTREIITSFSDRQLAAGNITQLQIPILLSVGDRDDLVAVSEIAQLYSELDMRTTALSILPSTPHQFHHLPLDNAEHAVRRFWAWAGGKR